MHITLPSSPPLRCLLSPCDKLHLILVGCGGTGSQLAGSLARIASHAATQGIDVQLTLVDGDVVEPKNLFRQAFYAGDVAHNKAVALAWRLNALFGLKCRAIPEYLSVSAFRRWELLRPIVQPDSTLIIGCVDTPSARRAIARIVDESVGRIWWLDCGNDHHSGHLYIGNCGEKQLPLAQPELAVGLWKQLPAPHIQDPAIIESVDQPTASCAERVALDEQSLLINTLMAAAAAHLVQHFVQRELHTFATQLNAVPPVCRSRLITLDELRPWLAG